MKILVFGDSITQGFWDSQGGWVARMRKHLDQQFINGEISESRIVFNLGVSADTTVELLKRFTPEVEARQGRDPDLVIVIAIGVNDSRIDGETPLMDVSEYAANIEMLIEQAKVFTDKVMCVGLTPCVVSRTTPVSWVDISYTNERISRFDNELSATCKNNKIALVPIFSELAKLQESSDILPDGLHPNDEGHEVMWQLVKPHLDELITS